MTDDKTKGDLERVAELCRAALGGKKIITKNGLLAGSFETSIWHIAENYTVEVPEPPEWNPAWGDMWRYAGISTGKWMLFRNEPILTTDHRGDESWFANDYNALGAWAEIARGFEPDWTGESEHSLVKNPNAE